MDEDKKINERLIKFSQSKIVVDDELKLGDDVEITAEYSVIQVIRQDNQDGTYNEVYLVKPSIGYVGRNRKRSNRFSWQTENLPD